MVERRGRTGLAGGVKVALMWARADWRRRWGGFVALGVLIGIAGAVVLTAAAGANRTSSAYDRLVAATARYDVQVQDDGDGAPLLPKLASLPGVAASDRIQVTWAPASHGSASIDQLVVAAGTDDSWTRDFDRPLMTDGRMPDPSSPDEVLLNNHAARQLGAGVGDTVEVATLAPDEFYAQVLSGEPPGAPDGPAFRFEVVGVGRLPDDVDAPDPAMIVSSSVFREHADLGRFDNNVWLRLDRGQEGVQDFVAAAEALPEHDPSGVYFTFAEQADQRVIDGIALQRVGLLLFALVGFVVVAAVSVQAVGRQLAAGANGERVLAALGVPRLVRALSLALPFAGVAAIASVTAAGVAVAASPVLPTGFARVIEPDPGVDVDLGVLMPGGLLLAAVVVAAAAGAALLRSRGAERAAPVAPSRVTALAAAAGLGPVGVTGLRMAFESGSGRARLPVRSTVVGLVLGVTGAIAVLTFGASLDHLLRTDSLYGWTWDLAVSAAEDPAEVNRVAQGLATAEGVRAASLAEIDQVTIDGQGVSAVGLEPVRGQIDVVYLEGRAPSAPDEVALGPDALDELGASVGDHLDAAAVDGTDTSLLVVGSPLIAAEGEYARLAVVTPDGLERLDRSDGYGVFLVDAAGPADEAVAAVTDAESSGPSLPTAIENLRAARGVPGALAVFMAALAGAAIGHALLIGVRRRARDLAVLRALGCRRRQVAGVVVVQSIALCLVGGLLGVVLGVAVGRGAWAEFAGGLDVVVRPQVPAVQMTAFVVLLAVVACAFAALRARFGRGIGATDLLTVERA